MSAAVPYLRPLPTPPWPRRVWLKLGWNLALAVEVVAVVVLWELLVGVLRLTNPEFFPPPSAIGSAFKAITSSGVLGENIAFSVRNFVIGYAIAAVVGIAIGLTMGTSPRLSLALSPFVWTFYSTPRVAIAPLLVLWLGFGAESKIAMVALMAVFPILVNVMVGGQNVDQTLLRAGRVFGASRLDLYRKVVLPFTLPYTITGLRLGIGRGLIGIVIGEFIGSSAGLGLMILRAASQFDLATTFAVLLVLLVMANASMVLLDAARARIAPWYRETTF
ncbi:MAG: ABC transporter permease [Chloroflexi bacterium]|nr:ABC transporter permease [Chloroflexota bacterium]